MLPRTEGGLTRSQGLGLGNRGGVNRAQIATGAQRSGHGDLRDGAVRQEAGCVHRVMARVNAGCRQGGGMGAREDPILRNLALGATGLPTLTVGQDQRSECRGDEQARHHLEGEQVLAKQQSGDALDIAAVLRIGCIETNRRDTMICTMPRKGAALAR